jgi:hypothetical protein
MISYDVIQKCNATGQYYFPFIPSHKADCVRDFSITFSEFVRNKENHFSKEFEGVRYKYTPKELKECWEMILIQRLRLRAIIMIVENKFIGINQAIRHINELERQYRND